MALKGIKFDRLMGDTQKCCDCGKQFYLDTKGASKVRGPDCHQKFLVVLARDLKSLELDYNKFLFDNPNLPLVAEVNNDLLNDLFADDPDLESYLTIDHQTASEIKLLNSKMKTGDISFDELHRYTSSPSCEVKELAVAYFYDKYAKHIDPELVSYLSVELKFKFATNYKTTFLTLDILKEDSNKMISTEAKRTLSIIKNASLKLAKVVKL